jgi:hypothetical protein
MSPQRLEDARELLRAGVADDRAIELRQARPVDVRRRAALVLVAADQGNGVATRRIRDGHARVCGDANPRRNAGHDFERNALLVQEERLFAAAAEDEGVAPLQPRDDLAFARLLPEQDADRLLLRGMRRRGPDLEQLGVAAGFLEQPRRDQPVVNDHVRGAQALKAAYRDQAGIARPRPDQIDRALHHG